MVDNNREKLKAMLIKCVDEYCDMLDALEQEDGDVGLTCNFQEDGMVVKIDCND